MKAELVGITTFPTTKSGIKLYAENALNDILDGYINPLEAKVKLSAMKSVIEAIEKSEEFRNAVINEAEKYHKEELKDLYNSSIQIKETGVKWDYSNCNHPQYDRLMVDI